jgi:hypothetical protein
MTPLLFSQQCCAVSQIQIWSTIFTAVVHDDDFADRAGLRGQDRQAIQNQGRASSSLRAGMTTKMGREDTPRSSKIRDGTGRGIGRSIWRLEEIRALDLRVPTRSAEDAQSTASFWASSSSISRAAETRPPMSRHSTSQLVERSISTFSRSPRPSSRSKSLEMRHRVAGWRVFRAKLQRPWSRNLFANGLNRKEINEP